MASYGKGEEANEKFEKWLHDKLKSNNSDQEADASLFSNYILSMLDEEENSDEEKKESIKPILQELNQNNSFNEDALVDEIITTWNQMKLDEKSATETVNVKNTQELNPTDTILSMINKHKTQLVDVKKHEALRDTSETYSPADYGYSEDEPEADETAVTSKADIFVNTNSQDAASRDKQTRDKLAEAQLKQKEQAKKALIDQKEREVERKKKAQQKAAKVERKR